MFISYVNKYALRHEFCFILFCFYVSSQRNALEGLSVLRFLFLSLFSTEKHSSRFSFPGKSLSTKRLGSRSIPLDAVRLARHCCRESLLAPTLFNSSLIPPSRLESFFEMPLFLRTHGPVGGSFHDAQAQFDMLRALCR